MGAVYYIEANLACIIILMMLLLNEVRNPNRNESRIILANTIQFHIFSFVAHSLWMLVNSGIIARNTVSLGIVNYAIYLLMEACMFWWFLFSENIAGSSKENRKRISIRAGIPMFLSAAALLICFLTGNVYYMEENGRMHLPYLYYSFMMVPFSYNIITGVRCIRRARDPKYYSDRDVYIGISVYPVILTISGVLQMFWQQLPTICFGSTIAVVYVYILVLNGMISTDPLTQLNNRNQLNRYLQNIDREKVHGFSDSVYIMMIDVDRFKTINDSYGHQAGDRALTIIAECLKRVCGHLSTSRPFLARYGGDEFIMVVHAQSESSVSDIRIFIRNTLEQICASEDLPYELSLSIGWSCAADGRSIPDCLRAADESMYQDKQTRKRAA